MSSEKSIQLYDKIDKICNRIDSYTEKEITVKNQTKSASYIKKIEKLISMLENAKQYAEEPTSNDKNKEENIAEEENDNKYNPYSEEFIYKDSLKQCDGNIYNLLELLKEKDKIGYRHAYEINEIINYILNSEYEELKQQVREYQKKYLNIKEKVSLWERIKRIFGLKKAKHI